LRFFVINLVRVPDRADYILKEAHSVGLDEINLFATVDAEDLDIEGIAKFYKPRAWGKYWELSKSLSGVRGGTISGRFVQQSHVQR
jgi:hypothetical protein